MSPVPAKPNALRLVQHGAGEPAVAMAEPTVAIAGAVQTAPPTTAPFLRKSRLLWLDMMHPFSIPLVWKLLAWKNGQTRTDCRS